MIWNKGRIFVPKAICPNCGKTFLAYKNNKVRQRFCSIHCSKSNHFSPVWKGDNVKYEGLHNWIRKRLSKPKLCIECKINPPYDLANISQEYKRDISDWEWLCRKCHMTKDGRLENAKKTQYKNGHVSWTKTHSHSKESLEKMSKTWFKPKVLLNL